MESFMPWALGALISIILGKYVYDWYHETDKRNRYMEAQINLLMHIAAHQGVDKDKIAEIVALARMGGSKSDKKLLQSANK